MIEEGSNKRIIVNTAFIYGRLIVTLGVSLFATRYVLQALGAEDFGLYNVIAGVVAMFAFLSATMATTSQRYISFTRGETNDLSKLRIVFGSSITVHAILSLVLAVVVFGGGWWMIDHLLSIPDGKHGLAIFVLVTVTFGLIGTINSVPFEALLMAHENIFFVSVCQVVYAFVKFGGALLLLYINSDRLIVYSIILGIVPFVVYAMEAAYCLKNYPESRITKQNAKPSYMMKEFSKFAGWVMVGTVGTTVKTQGISILFNVFWGVVANAANGIAVQVNSTLQFFTASITTSLRPQLVQSAGEGNHSRMMTLAYAACKYQLLLVSLVACPLIVAMPYVLSLWLKDVPEYTVLFCQTIFIATMARQTYMGLLVGLEAQGDVKYLNIILGTVYIAVIPVGYIMAKIGLAPDSIYWGAVGAEVVIGISLILLSKNKLKLKVGNFISVVLVRSIAVIILLFLINWIMWHFMNGNVLSLLCLLIVDLVAFSLLSYFIALTSQERKKVLSFIRRHD